MVFKDFESLSSLYEGITKKIEPSKDQLVRQAPLVNQNEINGTTNLLEEAYQSVQKKPVLSRILVSETYSDEQIKGCEDAIKMMASGTFKNVPQEMMEKVKSCSMFSVETDPEGKHTVIIKDEAIPSIERVYPEMKGKFMSEEQCRKDVAECRKGKLEESKKKAKPDYLDVDKDGNKKESMKKALSDKKKKSVKVGEGISSFKDLFNRVIAEGKKEHSMKGTFHDEEESNPHLKSDRKKLEELRAKRKKEAAKKK